MTTAVVWGGFAPIRRDSFVIFSQMMISRQNCSRIQVANVINEEGMEDVALRSKGRDWGSLLQRPVSVASHCGIILIIRRQSSMVYAYVALF